MAWCSIHKKIRIFKHYSVCIDNGGKIHPTQKPIALYTWLIQKYANQGDKIFDPMMGSQSSRIAAYKMGFDYVGCELDEEYFQKGCERFERECHGIVKVKDGSIVQQTKLDIFDS